MVIARAEVQRRENLGAAKVVDDILKARKRIAILVRLLIECPLVD